MPDHLLRDIYELGEKMRAALDGEDLDRYFEALEERGTLLESLHRYSHPSEIADDWKDTARDLAHQHDALMAAVAGQQERLQGSLHRLVQMKGARRSYHGSDGRGRILSDDLRV